MFQSVTQYVRSVALGGVLLALLVAGVVIGASVADSPADVMAQEETVSCDESVCAGAECTYIPETNAACGWEESSNGNGCTTYGCEY